MGLFDGLFNSTDPMGLDPKNTEADRWELGDQAANKHWWSVDDDPRDEWSDHKGKWTSGKDDDNKGWW